MSTILFCRRLGSGFGYLMRMRPLAEGLAALDGYERTSHLLAVDAERGNAERGKRGKERGHPTFWPGVMQWSMGSMNEKGLG
jgi:hypothetical protein